jgi:hypothetical protein
LGEAEARRGAGDAALLKEHVQGAQQVEVEAPDIHEIDRTNEN